jgi:hypothetical protein
MTEAESQELQAGKTEFSYPADGLLPRIRDYFLAKYSDDISIPDAEFLAKIFADVRPEDLVSLNERRIASLRMAEILVAADRAMIQIKDPARTWRTIGLALGLPSATEFNGNSLSRQCGVSKMAISKSAKKLRASFDVTPAFDQHGSLNFRNLQH